MNKFTITRYATSDEALGRALRLSAFSAEWSRENTHVLYERIAGAIEAKQYFFINDARGNLGFIAYGHLNRESLARYVANLWPISHQSDFKQRRYIFIALSPFMDWTDIQEVLQEQAAQDKIEWWMRDLNAPALIKLAEK